MTYDVNYQPEETVNIGYVYISRAQFQNPDTE